MVAGVNINYWQRLTGTALSFALFGIGGLILSRLGFFIVRLTSRDPLIARLRIKKLVSHAFAFFMRFMAFTGVLHYEFEGLEKIRDDGGCIILANHPSLIDVVALISVYSQANCFVKGGLWENPMLSGIVRGTGYINSSSESALEEARLALTSGDSLIIFPEGTRSVPGKPLDLKRGASQLALRLNRPIRLVHISMNPSTLTKAERWYQIPPRRAEMKIRIGAKIEPKDYPSQDLPTSLRARHLTHKVKEKLERELAQG